MKSEIKETNVGAIINRPNGITLIALVITIVLNTFGVVVVNK